MRLFLKEHRPLVIIYLVQMLLVGVLFWLASDQHALSIAIYSAVLSLMMLIIYLAYRYISYQKLYKRLSDALGTLDQSLNEIGDAPLAGALQELLHNQFQLYKDELYDTHQRLEHHTAFINRWVHQMKTPISVIQLTLQDLDLEDEAADNIQEEIDRLKKGLEMALYTSRLDRFEHDFRVEEVVLRTAVEAAVADNRLWFIRHHVYPDIQIDEGITVLSDAKWLQFMMGQVMTNAVTYSAGKGSKVTFTAYQQGRQTIFEVKDEGVGILPEDLRRVFDPYFTGNRGRQYHESTGMGLYLVREVCTKLSHDVEIESVPERGTTVRFIFFKP